VEFDCKSSESGSTSTTTTVGTCFSEAVLFFLQCSACGAPLGILELREKAWGFSCTIWSSLFSSVLKLDERYFGRDRRLIKVENGRVLRNFFFSKLTLLVRLSVWSAPVDEPAWSWWRSEFSFSDTVSSVGESFRFGESWENNWHFKTGGVDNFLECCLQCKVCRRWLYRKLPNSTGNSTAQKLPNKTSTTIWRHVAIARSDPNRIIPRPMLWTKCYYLQRVQPQRKVSWSRGVSCCH